MLQYRGYRIATSASPHRGWRGLVYPPQGDQPLASIIQAESEAEALAAGKRLVDRHIADGGAPPPLRKKAEAREF